MDNQQIFLILLFVSLLLIVATTKPNTILMTQRKTPIRMEIKESQDFSLNGMTSIAPERVMKAAASGAVVIASNNGVTLDQGYQSIIVGTSAITMNAGNTSGTSVMTISNNGNVGIGTNSPSQPLHIKPGNLLLDGTTASLYMRDVNRGILYSAGTFSSSFPSDGLAVVGMIDGCLGTNDPNNGGSKSILSWNSSGAVAINQAITSSTPPGLSITGSLVLGTSSRIGIGTTNPSSNIEIQSVVGTPALSLIGDTNGPRMVFSSSLSYGNLYVANNANNYQQAVMTWDQSQTLNSVNVNNLYFSAGGSEQLRLTGYGCIGVGTTQPLGRLHLAINGIGFPTTWDSTQLLVGGISSLSGGVSLSYSTTTNSGYLSCIQPSLNGVSCKQMNYNSSSHSFYVGSSSFGTTKPVLSVTSNNGVVGNQGSVGINTSKPQGLLSVNFSASPLSPWGIGITGWDSNSVVFGSLSTGTSQGALNYSYHSLYQVGYLAMSSASGGFKPIAYGADSHYFYTNYNGQGGVGSVNFINQANSLPTPVMVISNNGGVGIGVTNPIGMFQIYSTAKSYNSINTGLDYIVNVGGATCTYTGSASTLAASSTPATSKSVSLQGTNMYYVNGYNGSTTGYGSQLVVNGGGFTSGRVNGSQVSLPYHGSIQFFVQNSSLEAMRVDGQTGWVGIGTNSPTAPLTIGTSNANGTFPSASQYFTAASSGFTLGTSGTVPVGGFSLIAAGGIYAGGVSAASDKRIKTDVVSCKKGLNTVLALNPCEYRFVDRVGKPNSDIGLIAQELKVHVPEAVRQVCDYIPDAYQKGRVIAITGRSVTVEVEKKLDWVKGDKVRVLSVYQGEMMGTVIETDDKISIEMKEEVQLDTTELFLWGKLVDDFHTVDYSKLVPILLQSQKELYELLIQKENERKQREEMILSRLEKLEK